MDTSSLGRVLGGVLVGVEAALRRYDRTRCSCSGDTNSCIAALMARRMRVPVYHMEAGNRCFDLNVPEETNRRLVDHVADFNLVYTEHARRNLLAEGLHPRRIQRPARRCGRCWSTTGPDRPLPGACAARPATAADTSS